MNIYCVGGAVRDRLLGREVNDHDWVVVGATAQQMLAQGYRPVGRDFPVFLHPQTKEEYALARQERKVGLGHQAFEFESTENVSLEQDLSRRDLTINAIAEDKQGALIDPFHGQKDLVKRKLRHVSEAFIDDPLRLLRVARLAAQLHAYHFQVAEETKQLMQAMVANQELRYLSKERLWQECEKALASDAPHIFFEVLIACGAANYLCSGQLSTTTDQDEISRPSLKPTEVGGFYKKCASPVCESDLRALQLAVEKSFGLPVRYALLQSIATRSSPLIAAAPKRLRELHRLVTKCAPFFQQIKPADPESILNFLLSADALRRYERFTSLLDVLEIIFAQQNRPLPIRRQTIIAITKGLSTLNIDDLLGQNLDPKILAERIREKRLQWLVAFW